MRTILCLTLVLVVPASAAAGTDLKKIDRKLKREPAYVSKAPRYCLLAFGPEARTLVWLVLDGNVLYVDRNGNGDLTEKGERIEAATGDKLIKGFDTFEVGDITEPDSRARHTDLRVVRFGRDSSFASVSLRVADRGEQVAGNDIQGALSFAEKPADAPIVHFNGPLQLSLTTTAALVRGAKAKLTVCIGTPGLGEGSFAALSNEDIPEDVCPVAVVEFPRKKGEAEGEKATVKFTTRC